VVGWITRPGERGDLLTAMRSEVVAIRAIRPGEHLAEELKELVSGREVVLRHALVDDLRVTTGVAVRFCTGGKTSTFESPHLPWR
jgi:hypothetical protein